MLSNQEIKIQNIDHLGIVAGLIDEIKIVKIEIKYAHLDSTTFHLHGE